MGQKLWRFENIPNCEDSYRIILRKLQNSQENSKNKTILRIRMLVKILRIRMLVNTSPDLQQSFLSLQYIMGKTHSFDPCSPTCFSSNLSL